ncbi:MAG: hypothetical protein QXH80_00035 [Candidatus Nanoarchaeia archaeon]
MKNKKRNEENDQLKKAAALLGKIGGTATLQNNGVQHFQKIGKMGGITLAKKYPHEQRVLWGKKGGRPRKNQENENSQNPRMSTDVQEKQK